MEIKTGQSNITIELEQGERVYPCRCGETHRGDYAIYDYGHHNCLHEIDLIALGSSQVICPLCGMSWRVDRNKEVK